MSTLQTTTSSTRPSAQAGDTYFETDTKNIIVYDGSNWRGYQNDGIFFSSTSNSYSVDFEGSNDYIDISGADGLFNSATVFSVSLWYYADAYGGGVFGTGTSGTDGVWLLPYSTSQFFFGVRDGGTTGIIATPPGLNQWVHVAATYNAGNGVLYLTPAGGSTTTYTSSSLPSSLSSSAGTDLSIGRHPGQSFYFNGRVDEVAIWDREITSTEVSKIINDKLYFGPSAMWRLENTAAATIGGSGYDGTLTNGPTYSTSTPY